jgi:acyl-CoA thioesterase FadM
MNHLFRLLWLMLFRGPGRRGTVPPLGPCSTPFRVLPTDLDLLMHVNNGIYLSLMDLGRVDLMRRSGILAGLRSRGWYPVVVAETIQFRRPLTLFQRFAIETSVLGWDDRAFLLEQRFVRDGEQVAAALVRARFLAKAGGSVNPADVLALGGVSGPSPALPDYAARWNSDQVWRDNSRSPLPAPRTPGVT